MESVHSDITAARKSAAGLLAAYNSPVLSAYRLLDTGAHVPTLMKVSNMQGKSRKRQSLLDCSNCEKRALNNVSGTCP